MIPERVYEQVVTTGIEQGYADARRIDRSVEADRFDVVAVETTPQLSRLQQNDHLSNADDAVLACAGAHDGVAVMDEQYGRDVAAAEEITTRGTAYLLLKLAKEGAIGADTARATVDGMIDDGWYCSPDIYAKIIRPLDALAD